MAFQRTYLRLCAVFLFLSSAFFTPSVFGANGIASKDYVDRAASAAVAAASGNYASAAQGTLATTAVQPGTLTSYLQLSGGTMTGDIAMGGKKITGLGAPSASEDGATKGYVDTALGDIQTALDAVVNGS